MLVAVMAALTVGAAAEEETFGNFGLTLNAAGNAYTVTSYTGKSDTVTIPSTFQGLPVTAIGKEAFQGKSLTAVRGLETIEEIGESAFASSSLKSVEIPGTMKVIAESAFANCGSLTSVKFKEGANSGSGSSTTEIKKDAFNGCTSLSTLDLSSSVRSIEETAFFNTAVTQVIVWEGTNSIGPQAFAGCAKLSTVAISKDVTTIGPGAFLPTKALTVIHYGGADGTYPQTANWTGDIHYNTIVSNKITAPKCDARGSSTRTVQCPLPITGCPSVSTREEIAELGHDIVHTLVSSDPSGYKPCQDHTDSYKDTCSRCSYVREYEVKVSAESPHDWADDVEDTANSKQPTDCKTPGVKRFKHVCKVCGEEEPVSKTEPIPALPHKYETKTVTIREATCSETGLSAEQEICSVCQDIKACETCEKLKDDQEKYEQHIKDSHNGQPIEKKGHTPGAAAYVVTKDPDCTNTGTKEWKFVCTICKKACDGEPDDALDHLPQEVPALGHDLAGGIETITKQPTCTESGTKDISKQACKREGCDYEQEAQTGIPIDPLDHAWKEVDGDGEIIKEATCTETGLREVGRKVCTRCDAEEKGTTEDIPLIAHKWKDPEPDEDKKDEDKAPTCGEAGESHVIVTCSVCRKTEAQTIAIPATGEHVWGEWETREPTETQDGEQKRICTVCEKEDVIILPATKDPSKPDDPDDPDEPEESKTYQITLVQGVGGAVSASRSTAKAGDAVTLTILEESGYELDMLRVTDGSRELSVSNSSGDRYRFTMPAANVEVRVTFERINSGGWSGSNWASAPGEGSDGDPRRTADIMPTQNPSQSVPRAGAWNQLFQDIPTSHWAAGEIAWANQMGFMNGSGGRFNPDGAITHQQMWMVLARLTGSRPANMEEARRWAVQGGFADGSSPNGAVTRHQLVTALYRCAHLMGSTNRNTTSLAGYADSRTVPTVAREAFSWAVANGIVGGTASGRLDPNGTLTRAQFAVILYRYSQRI